MSSTIDVLFNFTANALATEDVRQENRASLYTEEVGELCQSGLSDKRIILSLVPDGGLRTVVRIDYGIIG